MVVLGAIAIDNVSATENSDMDTSLCFTIVNEENDEWHLCAFTPEDKDAWMCAIDTAIGLPCAGEGEEGEEGEGGEEERMRHHKRR